MAEPIEITIWDVDSHGLKELCSRWGPDLLREGALLSGMTPGFSTHHQAPFGFPRMLLTSILIGWSQKQSIVMLIFSCEKSPPPVMRPVIKIL